MEVLHTIKRIKPFPKNLLLFDRIRKYKKKTI